MKKIFLSALLITTTILGFLSCEKEDTKSTSNYQTTNKETLQRTGSLKIDENNVGIYHNEMVNYVFEDLNNMSPEDINSKISTSSYTIKKMKEFCSLKNIDLPTDNELNSNFINNENTSIETLISNNIFNSEQKNILNECFNSLNMVNDDLSKDSDLNLILNNNLNKVKSHSENNGKKIAIAIINQLIASNELWITQRKINFLTNNNVNKGRPSNGQILAADAKALGLTLLGGGWTTPIGWCGSMFVGAGASIGTYMGSPLWWPF